MLTLHIGQDAEGRQKSIYERVLEMERNAVRVYSNVAVLTDHKHVEYVTGNANLALSIDSLGDLGRIELAWLLFDFFEVHAEECTVLVTLRLPSDERKPSIAMVVTHAESATSHIFHCEPLK